MRPSSITDRCTSIGKSRRATWLDRDNRNIPSAGTRGKIRREFNFPETLNGLYSAKFSPGGDVIATAFGDGTIQVMNRETGELLTDVKPKLTESLPILSCQFHPTDWKILYASSASGKIFTCNININECSELIEEPGNEVNAIDLSAGGDYIVSGGKDAALRLYDTSTGKIIHIYRGDMGRPMEERVEKFHRMRIFAAKFHKNFPELILSGGWDDTVRIWDRRIDKGSIRSIKGPHICGDALDVHGTKIITGSWTVEGSLQLWDMTGGRLMETIIPVNRPTTLDGEFLYVVQYFDGDPHGNLVIAGGTGTGAVEIIDLNEKMVVGKFEVAKAVVTIDSHRRFLVFGGFESTIRIGDFPDMY